MGRELGEVPHPLTICKDTLQGTRPEGMASGIGKNTHEFDDVFSGWIRRWHQETWRIDFCTFTWLCQWTWGGGGFSKICGNFFFGGKDETRVDVSSMDLWRFVLFGYFEANSFTNLELAWVTPRKWRNVPWKVFFFKRTFHLPTSNHDFMLV